jgi:hypothetical protein
MRLIRQDRKRSLLWGSVLLLLLSGEGDVATKLMPSSDLKIEITVPDANRDLPISIQIGSGMHGDEHGATVVEDHVTVPDENVR